MEFEVHGESDVVAVIDEDGDLVLKVSDGGITVLSRCGVIFIDSEASISEYGITKLIRKGDKVTITF